MICREYGHHSVGVLFRKDTGCESDGGGGIFTDWFREQFVWGKPMVLELPAGLERMQSVSDQKDPLYRDQRLQTVYGALQQGFVSRNIEKLLGKLLPASGPKSGAAAACQNDAVHG